MRPSRRDLLMTMTACAVAPPAFARDSAGDIADLLRRRIDDQKRGTGAAVGLIRNDHLTVVGHGRSGLERRRRPDGRSVFQIASLTKIFTALLLADAVARGEVALDDPLSRHLPVAPPTFNGRAITLLDLATHSSGLPLRPPSRADRDQNDPYNGYGEADLHADILATRLTRAPGAAFGYSNFDYGLLGDALCHRLGRDYGELLGERILEPLGMSETSLDPAPALLRRRVDGYDADFHPMTPWNFGALTPAGGLFSTIRDLAKFLALWIGADSGALALAAKSMLMVERPGDDADTRMALGWRITRRDGVTTVWSNGNGGGVRSFMGFAPHSATGVIAFANMATGQGVDDIGMHALDPRQPVDVSVIPVRIAIAVPPGRLEPLLGAYQYAPGDSITMERGPDGLVFVQGPNRVPLFAETPTLFFFKQDNVTLAFEPPVAGHAPALVLTEKGQPYRYVRLP